MDATAPPANRRPLKSRDSAWARSAAAAIARTGIAPNRISRLAIVFAALGGAALAGSGVLGGGERVAALVFAALAMQLRLLCNLFDGLVAVEHGKASPTGGLWNELPDRVADGFFLVGAGYGAALAGTDWGAASGWAAAVFAVLTAYVRELGRALGQPADFSGPMAKPQRMAVLTLAALVAAAEPLWDWRGETLAWACLIIALGAAATAARRTFRLSRRLKETS